MDKDLGPDLKTLGSYPDLFFPRSKNMSIPTFSWIMDSGIWMGPYNYDEHQIWVSDNSRRSRECERFKVITR